MITDTDIAPPAKEPPQPPRTSFYDSIWADVGTTAITLLSGGIAAVRSINKSFYQNIKINPDIEKEIETSKINTRNILREVKHAASDHEKRNIIYPKIAEQHVTHESAMRKILAEDYAVKGMWDKTKLLRPHQRWEVLLTVTATMAVALGAIYSLTGNRKVSQKQGELENQLDSIEANGKGR